MFAKLFSSITESSLWSEPKEVRLLFVTMLAKADQTGFVEAAVPGLARVANLTMEETQSALICLLSPDPHSKNPDNDGRRIAEVPGGYVLLNYEDYRSRRNTAERQEYMRRYMKEYRKQSVNKCKQSLTEVNASEPRLAQAEAEADITAVAVVAGATSPHDAPASSVSPVRDEVPSAQIIAAFDETFGTKSRLTNKRKTSLRARWGEKWWRENWQDALMRAAESEFLSGDNERGWTITIDFFLKPDTATHILEGKYDAREGNGWKNNPAQQRENGNAHAFAAYFGRIEKNSKDRPGADEAVCIEGPDPVY